MTAAPGFLGEAYMNFGFIGLLIVPAVAGVIVRAWDRLCRRSDVIARVLGLRCGARDDL